MILYILLGLLGTILLCILVRYFKKSPQSTATRNK